MDGPAGDSLDVVIRPAVPDDLAAVADVWWRSRQAQVPAIPAPVHPFPEVRAWLDDLIRRSRTATDGADEDDGVEVWVAAGAPAPDRVVAVLVLDGAELDQLYVDPVHVGCGIGSQLVGLAKRRRPGGLTLWAFQANDRARAFYRHHGFVEGRTTDADNEEQAPDVELTWRDESRPAAASPP